MSSNSKKDSERLQKKFLCPAVEELRINGDYNTETANLFNLKFIKCHDRPDCKKPEEITKILRGKYIIVAYNEIRFDA